MSDPTIEYRNGKLYCSADQTRVDSRYSKPGQDGSGRYIETRCHADAICNHGIIHRWDPDWNQTDEAGQQRWIYRGENYR